MPSGRHNGPRLGRPPNQELPPKDYPMPDLLPPANLVFADGTSTADPTPDDLAKIHEAAETLGLTILGPSPLAIQGKTVLYGDDKPGVDAARWLTHLCEKIGIVVHTVPRPADPGGNPVKRRWGMPRLSLSDVLDVIKAEPGIRFDDWVKTFLGDVKANPTTLAAARAKARCALSRLFNDMEIVKRKNIAGEMILYYRRDVPKLVVPALSQAAIDAGVFAFREYASLPLPRCLAKVHIAMLEAEKDSKPLPALTN